ncbi:MAG TPA: DUF4421 family protein [Cyclobacteriaceae bacterium]|nr:DUF4421 family protein [Cyclobacteriaceae bacterium]
MIRIILLVACTLCIQAVNAQTDTLNSEYIERYPDKFFVWPVIKKKELSFGISNRDDPDSKLNYKPNNAYSLGMGVYLFEVALELSFAIPIGDRSTNTYGASDVRDLQAAFLGNHWGADLFHQNYSGFYVANPNATPSSPDPYIKRSDIKLINTGVTGIYAFSKNKFSLKSAYNYSERQLKSAGSFVVSGGVNTLRLQADSTVLTQVYSPIFYPTSSFKEFQYTGLSLAPGYTYTLVYKSFFLNGVFSYGPTHYWISYTAKDQSTKYDISINTFADIRFSLGYNSDRIFGGLSLRAQTREVRFEDIKFTNASSTLRLLVGYRFREKGILKKRAKDIIPK